MRTASKLKNTSLKCSLVPRPLFFLFDCGWGNNTESDNTAKSDNAKSDNIAAAAV